MLRADFVVIGGGLAGISSALHASEFGEVLLLTKTNLFASNSYWAQGGIAAAIGDDDSSDFHFEDTIKAGAGLCHSDSTRILVEEGIERVRDLISMGMEFDQENGKIALGLEGNHSRRRVLHAGGDATGREIVNFLTKIVLSNQKIHIHENIHIFDLIVEDNKCYGVSGFNTESSRQELFFGRATIIASGGGSGIYSRTTNPRSSTGDGILLAYNAGAEIGNMEFIQFHPSSLVTEGAETFLISEAVRGEGAYLVNSSGERFMQNVHQMAELAPRDVVAYEMHKQLINGETIFLKLDHLDKVKIRSRFSNIYEEVLKYGIDITVDPVPVAPAAHYMIGGVKTGLWGETNVQNLYACGEVTFSGVHGANRLASNSLLECLVFGYRCIEHAINSYEKVELYPEREMNYSIDISLDELYLKQRDKVSKILTRYAGIARNENDLKEGLKKILAIQDEHVADSREYYTSKINNMINLSKHIFMFAIYRKESRGSHRREDYTDARDEFLLNIIKHKDYGFHTELIK